MSHCVLLFWEGTYLFLCHLANKHKKYNSNGNFYFVKNQKKIVFNEKFSYYLRVLRAIDQKIFLRTSS